MSEQQKGGLGRGLSALLPKVTLNQPTTTGERSPAAPPPPVETHPLHGGSAQSALGVVRELVIEDIGPNPKQPRTEFDDEGLDELAASIRELGVLQPVLVREVDGNFELVAGERRLRASLRAGRTTIPAIVRDHADDLLLLEALVENIQRVDLNPLDEAAAMRGLVDDLGITHDEVARRVGKSRASVTNALRLLNLGSEVQRRVRDGSISAAHARALAALTDVDQQLRAVRRIIAEGLSVRATERLVATMSSEGATLSARASATRAARKQTSASDRPPGVIESEMLLADHLETAVGLAHHSDGGGEITIRYAGMEDLDRIVRRILDHHGEPVVSGLEDE